MSQEHAAAAALHAAKMAQLNAHLGGHGGLDKLAAQGAGHLNNLLPPQFDLAKLANTAAFNAAVSNGLGGLAESVSHLTQNLGEDSNLKQQPGQSNSNSNISSHNDNNRDKLNSNSTSGLSIGQRETGSCSPMKKECEDNDQENHEETDRHRQRLLEEEQQQDLMENDNSHVSAALSNLMAGGGSDNLDRLRSTVSEKLRLNKNAVLMTSSGETFEADIDDKSGIVEGRSQQHLQDNFRLNPNTAEDRLQSTS